MTFPLSARVVLFFCATFVASTPLQAQLQRVSYSTSAATSTDLTAFSDAPASPAHEEANGGAAQSGDSAGHTLLHAIGVELHVGMNGVGADFALPVARKFNVRVGGEYLQYTGHFTDEGAEVDAKLQVGGGKVALDWFPFGNGFRVSPQVRFAVQTQADANVMVPGGTEVDFAGGTYTSSPADPLHGNAVVTTRKTAPGISIGWGNISPRGNKHLSFPVEIGAYYVGQPNLALDFAGSVCSPDGCQAATSDPDFQKDKQKFIDRQNHNLSYATWLPIVQVGVGYRF